MNDLRKSIWEWIKGKASNITNDDDKLVILKWVGCYLFLLIIFVIFRFSKVDLDYLIDLTFLLVLSLIYGIIVSEYIRGIAIKYAGPFRLSYNKLSK